MLGAPTAVTVRAVTVPAVPEDTDSVHPAASPKRLAFFTAQLHQKRIPSAEVARSVVTLAATHRPVASRELGRAAGLRKPERDRAIQARNVLRRSKGRAGGYRWDCRQGRVLVAVDSSVAALVSTRNDSQ